MADIFTDLYNTACKMLGINQQINSTSECQQKVMHEAMQNQMGIVDGIKFNVDSATSANRNIIGMNQGSMTYDTSFKFNTDSSTIRKVSPVLIQDYHNRVVDGTHFN